MSMSLDIVGEFNVRGNVRLSRRMKDLRRMWTMQRKRRKGRSRADDDAELDERVGGVKWCSTR